jgi:aspartyl-tRNA(Asn)/glutamyl-tRNA(Gln) amidotransferase subunit C
MVSRDQVLHVARLARLRLTPEEEELHARQLGRILEYVDQLRELDEAEGVGEADRITPDRPLRADEPVPSLPREEVLRLAPASDGETYRVPPVIEGPGA